jgi:hypothetical protein
MAIIVNRQPRKTSYIARVYILVEGEQKYAQSIRVTASDGNPVVVEVPDISEEERSRMRNGNTGWCYIDVIARLEEKIEGPTISECEPVEFTYLLDSPYP